MFHKDFVENLEDSIIIFHYPFHLLTTGYKICMFEKSGTV